jgi:hypothetical protein
VANYLKSKKKFMSTEEEKILELINVIPNNDKSENFIKYQAELIWRSSGGDYEVHLNKLKSLL